jgi:hypothetical protein
VLENCVTIDLNLSFGIASLLVLWQSGEDFVNDELRDVAVYICSVVIITFLLMPFAIIMG